MTFSIFYNMQKRGIGWEYICQDPHWFVPSKSLASYHALFMTNIGNWDHYTIDSSQMEILLWDNMPRIHSSRYVRMIVLHNIYIYIYMAVVKNSNIKCWKCNDTFTHIGDPNFSRCNSLIWMLTLMKSRAKDRKSRLCLWKRRVLIKRSTNYEKKNSVMSNLRPTAV